MSSIKARELNKLICKNSFYIRPLSQTDQGLVNTFLQKFADRVNTEEIADFVIFNIDYEIVGLYDTSCEAFQDAEDQGLTLYWVQ